MTELARRERPRRAPRRVPVESGRATAVKRAVIGRPMASGELEETLLPKLLALPIFSSDPLSSVAYATEAALLVIVGASLAARQLVFPLAIGIAAFLAIVVVSYTQVVRAYAGSGGAYVVARENLGRLPSLLAGASLLTDYVLTVAVSVAAGVLALTSAVPALGHHRLLLSLGCVALITFVNLRGVRETGLVFAAPTYLFLASMGTLVAAGVARCAAGSCPAAVVPDPVATGTASSVGLFVILKAFSSGSSALTGVEAIANGVTAFRPPQARNAARTQLAMGALAVTLFLGVSWLAVRTDARPSESVSLVSELARAVFPAGSWAGFMYYAVQVCTLAILVFAANTSYQGFPRLAAIMARDGYFPRQFTNLGDRLVYSNGILVLGGLSALLLVAFSANVISLIHLYVIGVFTAFTLSQAGMVVHWRRARERGWRRSATLNAAGAVATGVVAVVVVLTKFSEGAWMVVVAIPVLIALFLLIGRHYRRVAARLRAGAAAVVAAAPASNDVVLYVERVDAATEEALWYARRIGGTRLHAVHVPFDGAELAVRARFGRLLGGEVPLELLARQGGSVADAVLEHVWSLPRRGSDFVTVVVPELFAGPSLLRALLHRTTLSLKVRLLREPGVVIVDVPRLAASTDPLVPPRAVCLVPVSGAHAASARAALYARTLGLEETCAVLFAADPEEAARARDEWERLGVGVSLEVVEAPYRDLAGPLLARIRAITADPGAVAVVVMPELVVRGWQRFLHNQRALYVKRLLLFEPRVILASVPFHLD